MVRRKAYRQTAPFLASHAVSALAAASLALAVLAIGALVIGAGCGYQQAPSLPYELWDPPQATPAELNNGLIMLYPGVLSTTNEMINLFVVMKSTGFNRAIDIAVWGHIWEGIENITAYDRNIEWSAAEAARLAEYMRSRPDRPVSLIGFSGGAAIAVWVAERLPEDLQVDRIVLISPGLSAGYDLGPMLSRCRRGAVCYWSAADVQGLLAALVFGTMDRLHEAPAGTVGFAMQWPGLLQVGYGPAMAAYGLTGNHFELMSNPLWIHDFVVPWVLEDFSPSPSDAPQAQQP